MAVIEQRSPICPFCGQNWETDGPCDHAGSTYSVLHPDGSSHVEYEFGDDCPDDPPAIYKRGGLSWWR